VGAQLRFQGKETGLGLGLFQGPGRCNHSGYGSKAHDRTRNYQTDEYRNKGVQPILNAIDSENQAHQDNRNRDQDYVYKDPFPEYVKGGLVGRKSGRMCFEPFTGAFIAAPDDHRKNRPDQTGQQQHLGVLAPEVEGQQTGGNSAHQNSLQQPGPGPGSEGRFGRDLHTDNCGGQHGPREVPRVVYPQR